MAMDKKLRRANLRTAAVLMTVTFSFYLGFILLQVARGT